ncbi:MAG: alpha/beta fold hydrolase [Nitrospiraceae bacterium]|nr:alpha/beta fold hydrolase [Nitrospiraceae bacterium]
MHTPASAARSTPLLFVHGMWHGAWCWEENFLPYFAKHGYHSCALSLRGHGASEGRKRLRWTSIDEYVADIDQVVCNMEKPPVLIGHSMGGMITQKYLESRRVPAAVLLAPVPPWGMFTVALRYARHHPMLFLRANLTMSVYPLVATVKLCRELLFSPDLPEPVANADSRKMQEESFRAALELIFFTRVRIGAIGTRMLVLGGERDRLITTDEIRNTARLYGADAEILPGMAHDVMLDSGWQGAADRILGWLEKEGF